MSKVPKWKAILIVAVILLCVYGAIGIPKSKAELVANWNHNIRLGLDLKGGTLLQRRLGLASRATKDVDGLIRGDLATLRSVIRATQPLRHYQPTAHSPTPVA